MARRRPARFCPVPMIDIGRTPGRFTCRKREYVTGTGAGQRDTVSDDHVLPGRMRMPRGACTRREMDIGTGEVRFLVFRKQDVDLHIAGKQIVRPGERPLRPQRIQGLG